MGCPMAFYEIQKCADNENPKHNQNITETNFLTYD